MGEAGFSSHISNPTAVRCAKCSKKVDLLGSDAQCRPQQLHDVRRVRRHRRQGKKLFSFKLRINETRGDLRLQGDPRHPLHAERCCRAPRRRYVRLPLRAVFPSPGPATSLARRHFRDEVITKRLSEIPGPESTPLQRQETFIAHHEVTHQSSVRKNEQCEATLALRGCQLRPSRRHDASEREKSVQLGGILRHAVHFVRVHQARPQSAEARQIGSGEIVLHVEVSLLLVMGGEPLPAHSHRVVADTLLLPIDGSPRGD